MKIDNPQICKFMLKTTQAAHQQQTANITLTLV